jgi:hypothetical protein
MRHVRHMHRCVGAQYRSPLLPRAARCQPKRSMAAVMRRWIILIVSEISPPGAVRHDGAL